MSLFQSVPRLSTHDSRVEFLDTLAVLLRCTESVGSQLPDGCRPDVLRMDIDRNILFIGDAKVTELPGCKQSQVRLLRYLRWLSAHIDRPTAFGLFAICFGRMIDAEGWLSTISCLAREISLSTTEKGVVKFDHHLFVAWFLFPT